MPTAPATNPYGGQWAINQAIPGLAGTGQKALGIIDNALGGLPSPSMSRLGNAYFGSASGLDPTSEFLRNRGFDLYNRNAQAQQRGAIQDLGSLMGALSGNVAPTPGEQIGQQESTANRLQQGTQFQTQIDFEKQKYQDELKLLAELIGPGGTIAGGAAVPGATTAPGTTGAPGGTGATGIINGALGTTGAPKIGANGSTSYPFGGSNPNAPIGWFGPGEIGPDGNYGTEYSTGGTPYVPGKAPGTTQTPGTTGTGATELPAWTTEAADRQKYGVAGSNWTTGSGASLKTWKTGGPGATGTGPPVKMVNGTLMMLSGQPGKRSVMGPATAETVAKWRIQPWPVAP